MQISSETFGKVIGEITSAVEKPVLVGKMIQVLTIPDDGERTKAIVRMYLDPDVARMRAKDIVPAVAFFVGMSEGTATIISTAIQSELCGVDHPRLEGRPADGMRIVPEFQYGCIVGFLEGLAKLDGCCESAQRQLGHDLIHIVKWDKCKSIVSHECHGGISNATSAIFEKYPFFASEFYDAMCHCPADWVVGAYAVRICDCFLHKVLGIERLTLKEKATALKALHDKARFGVTANKPDKEDKVDV